MESGLRFRQAEATTASSKEGPDAATAKHHQLRKMTFRALETPAHRGKFVMRYLGHYIAIEATFYSLHGCALAWFAIGVMEGMGQGGRETRRARTFAGHCATGSSPGRHEFT